MLAVSRAQKLPLPQGQPEPLLRLHLSAWLRRKGNRVRLPRCRHNPELLHQLQTTLVSPDFDNFAAPEVIDVHASNRDVLPCRGKSPYRRYLDVPSVCPTDGPAHDDLVPFRKEILDRRTEIGKRRAPSEGRLLPGVKAL
jgi:hypothetical protein